MPSEHPTDPRTDTSPEAGTKPGPANPRTDEGVDAATPPGGPLRSDAAGAPGDHQPGTSGGDVVHDDHPGGGDGAVDAEDPEDRPDVASAPEPGRRTSDAQEENAETSEHEPSSSSQ